MITPRASTDAALFRALVESCADVFTLVDENATILYTSVSVERVLGYQPQERLGENGFSLIHEDDLPAVAEAFARAVALPATPQFFASRIRRKDGSWTHIEATLVNRLAEPVAGVVVNYRDVSEKRATEEQSRHSQKMEAVGRLARGIAHDFNNVLAAIVGNADLLHLRIKKGDPMAADLMEITDAAERGAALTRQLLAFSRAGESTEPQVLDFHVVVKGFDNMLQRLSGDIELRLHTPGASPHVRIQPGQIEQMMMNLVLNAREAVSAGGTIDVHADTLTVDAANATRYLGIGGGTYARLAVRDDGKGISKAIERHLFEPFFSTKDPAKGPGLGLAIVYGIAKEAGGTVSFSSAPGEGTIFEVLLPIVSS
jgi:two-component system, cell cycle sensor histidine kinase and response regulator CckA